MDAYKKQTYLDKITLIQTDPSKGTAPNNYRPIICLPMMWKILTAQIREDIYDSLISRRLFPKEQKGCRKWTRGTEELLYIDPNILKESKMRRKNVAMTRIVFKKACDMVPQSWKIDCFQIYKISSEKKFIENTMKNCRVELIGGGRCLTEVKI